MDVPLQHGDMWMVCGVQSEALRKNFPKTGVRGACVLDHGLIRKKQNVDSGGVCLAGQAPVRSLINAAASNIDDFKSSPFIATIVSLPCRREPRLAEEVLPCGVTCLRGLT